MIMKNHLLIILSLLFFHVAFSQEESVRNDDCYSRYKWFPKIGNPTLLDSLKCDIFCSSNRNNLNNKQEVLDSLLIIHENDGFLNMSKGDYLMQENYQDTLFLKYYKKAAKIGFEQEFLYTNISIFYFNYSLNDLTKESKLSILANANKYIQKALLLHTEAPAFKLEVLGSIKMQLKEVENKDLHVPKHPRFFDTLYIMTHMRSCGEFGGHMEYIKCYQKEDKLLGIFSVGKAFCEQGFQPSEESLLLNYKTSPQIIDSIALQTYLNYFNSITDEMNILSNAPSCFWVLIDNDYYFRRDLSGNSEEYKTFRNDIFK